MFDGCGLIICLLFCTFRIIQINYDAVDKFGTDSSQLIRIIKAQQLVEERQQQQQQQQQQ